MKSIHIFAALLAVALFSAFTETASAYYHTGMGRFVNRDPIGYRAGSANLYEYVGGRPIGHVDPMGHCKVRAGAKLHFYEILSNLDKEVKGNPHQELADSAHTLHHWAGGPASSFGVKLDKYQAAGVYSGYSKKEKTTVSITLFFVSWDICETKENPCRLLLDETGTATYVNHYAPRYTKDGKIIRHERARWIKVKEDGVNHHDITNKSYTRKVELQNSIGIYDKRLIFADGPENFTVGGDGSETKRGVVQKFKILDSNNKTIATYEHTVWNMIYASPGMSGSWVTPMLRTGPFN